MLLYRLFACLKVIRTELAGKESSIREIVRMAIESVLDRESLVIKVHPDDHKELEDYAKEIRKELSLVPGASRVELYV